MRPAWSQAADKGHSELRSDGLDGDVPIAKALGTECSVAERFVKYSLHDLRKIDCVREALKRYSALPGFTHPLPEIRAPAHPAALQLGRGANDITEFVDSVVDRESQPT